MIWIKTHLFPKAKVDVAQSMVRKLIKIRPQKYNKECKNMVRSGEVTPATFREIKKKLPIRIFKTE